MSPKVKAEIVIVDDSNTIRMLLRSILREDGHQVVGQEADGSQLISLLEKLTPNIVCLDYNLPGANGLDLLKEIHTTFPDIAVVMITADETEELRSEATKAGASGFITKPFSEAIILKEINQVALAQKLLTAPRKESNEQPGNPPKARAVIADDSKTMRQLLASILEHENIEVVGQASDGAEAIDMTLVQQPDIVCLDIEMPNVDGLQALTQIKELGLETKILIISSSADKNNVVKAVQMGALGYILKPYQPDQVVAAIAKLFN